MTHGSSVNPGPSLPEKLSFKEDSIDTDVFTSMYVIADKVNGCPMSILNCST